MARTKILATMGPASFDRIEELVRAGLDGVRINMSHVKPLDYDFSKVIIDRARSIDDNIFFVGDIQGPKIRLGDFETRKVKKGDKIDIFTLGDFSGEGISIQLDLWKHVSPGNLLLIDDGNVGARVKDISGRKIICGIEYGDCIESRKGVNVPDVNIPMDYLSEKDRRDLDFLMLCGFHYVSASYARSAEDIKKVRDFVGDKLRIIGKPENYEGEKNLKEIIEASDAMMVPRGDYGMERGVENVPAFQKKLIEECNVAGKPVITATQMLESMMSCKEPKRAEVSDVFNAALDGSDVVMLSGETSKGNYPVETVEMMNRILERAEDYLFDRSNGVNLGEKVVNLVKNRSVSDAMGKAVYAASKSEDVSAILVPTHRGSTVRNISRYRIEKPIIAICYDPEMRRANNISWGVIPIFTDNRDEKLIVEDSIERAKAAGLVQVGDRVIVTGGVGSYERGSTNMMRIERVY
jgi:pyruvate kinase